MLGKIQFIQRVLQTFHNVTFGAKFYLVIRLLLLPHGFLKILYENLSPRQNIIDVGCGYGLVTLFLSYVWHTWNIKGVDINSTRIQDLQALKLPNSISFLERDLIKDGFSWLEWYDTAVLVDILHHLDEDTQVQLLLFLSQHCKEIIIKDIDTTPRYKYYWNFFHDRYVMGNEVLCFLWSDRIESELIKNWFLVKREKVASPFPYPHYMLIASKK